jgi:hypothetical protein
VNTFTFNASSHPIGIIQRLTPDHGESLSFEFSRYKYEPRAIEDNRKSFRVDLEDAVPWVEKMVAGLGSQEDLAFHSRVYLKNERIRQIPMIDFVGKPTRADLNRVAEALGSFQISSFDIFDSGRSLHLYGLTLITHEEWLRFLGRILLLNLPGQPEVVDTRWVGHRLMAGYGTLRWTKNNDHYQKLPSKILEADIL